MKINIQRSLQKVPSWMFGKVVNTGLFDLTFLLPPGIKGLNGNFSTRVIGRMMWPHIPASNKKGSWKIRV